MNAMQKGALLSARTNELLVVETQLKKARAHIKALIEKHPRYGTNSGHGHVWERPDGQKARCSGTRHCTPCKEDQAEIDAVIEAARAFLETKK